MGIRICEVELRKKEYFITDIITEVSTTRDAVDTMKRIAEIGKAYIATGDIGGKIFYKKTSEKGSILGVMH